MSHARTIGVMTALNLIGAVFAFGNSLVQANLFGTSREMEVYFAAATLLTVVTGLSQSGNLASIFLPVYHRLRREQDVEAARNAFSVLLNWTVVAISAGLILLALATPLLMAALIPGFGPADRRLGTTMFRWLLPLLPLTVAYNFLTTLANAERQFGKPEATRVAQRIVAVVTTLALYAPLGIWALVAALWLSKVAGLVGQWVVMHRAGFRHRLIFSQKGFRVGTIFGHMGHSLASSGALQLYIFSLTSALSLLPQGHFAVFKYVQQLFNHLQTALLRPVSTVFFTQIAEAAAEQTRRLKPIMQRALHQMLAIWAVVLAMAVVAGEPALRGLWGSRAFGSQELALAADVLVGMLIVFLALAPNQLTVYTNLSTDAVRTQYTVHAVARVAAAGYAWLLVPVLGIWGAVAVLGLNNVSLAVASAWVLWHRRKVVVTYARGPSLRLAVAILAGIVLGHVPLALGLEEMLGGGRLADILLGGIVAGAAFFGTVGVGWLLGVREFRQLIDRLGWAG